jgi:hypothetical protein
MQNILLGYLLFSGLVISFIPAYSGIYPGKIIPVKNLREKGTEEKKGDKLSRNNTKYII